MPAKGRRRSINQMVAGAIESKKEDEVSRLREELAELRANSQSSGVSEILVADITALRLPDNLKQPRRYFDPAKLAKLEDSIQKHGVLEPIMVRPAVDGRFETVSGERRWRCCAALGIQTIPATVRELDDKTALEIALIAQLLNEGISVIEQTDSIIGLLRLRLGKTFEETTRFLHAAHNYLSKGIEGNAICGDEDKIGIVAAILEEFGLKIGSFVSNRLPLLKMPTPVLEAVREGRVSPTNAQIVAKQPEEWHYQLLADAEQLTKDELQRKIAGIRAQMVQQNLSAHAASGSGSLLLGETSASISLASATEDVEIELDQYVFDGIKAIRKRKTQLLTNKKVRTRLIRIAKELKEIQAIAKEAGIEL